MIPDVSVIIPTRDALTWLPTAIASVGPDPRVELLVVDDGSTDGSLAFLEALAARDTRLRILHGRGQGPAMARNLAIAIARGRYCAFLDADDAWMPGKLDTQLAFHRANPDLGFSFTDYRHITTEGADRGGCFAYWTQFHARHGHRTAPFRLDRALSTLFAENVVGTSTVMARTSLLLHAGGYSTRMVSAEDWELWLALAARAPVGVIPGMQANYLMHRPGNMTGKLALRVLAIQAIAARYRTAALAEDPMAARRLDARLAAARAEIAEASGARLRAAWLRLKALATAPSRRAAMDFAGALLRPA
jgi:glycosyltransferase involved in cell wall biosynthesis